MNNPLYGIWHRIDDGHWPKNKDCWKAAYYDWPPNRRKMFDDDAKAVRVEVRCAFCGSPLVKKAGEGSINIRHSDGGSTSSFFCSNCTPQVRARRSGGVSK